MALYPSPATLHALETALDNFSVTVQMVGVELQANDPRSIAFNTLRASEALAASALASLREYAGEYAGKEV